MISLSACLGSKEEGPRNKDEALFSTTDAVPQQEQRTDHGDFRKKYEQPAVTIGSYISIGSRVALARQ